MNENEINLLSEQLRLERLRNRISLEEMAKLLGMTRPTYTELEKHPNRISLEQGLAINYILNWNIYDFILSDILQNAIKEGK